MELTSTSVVTEVSKLLVADASSDHRDISMGLVELLLMTGGTPPDVYSLSLPLPGSPPSLQGEVDLLSSSLSSWTASANSLSRRDLVAVYNTRLTHSPPS